MPLTKIYKRGLWDIYAHAISMVGALALAVSFVVGGYDLVKLAFPSFTLSSALHEKYRTNESYTEFGTFKKDLSQEDIAYERTANYEKLLRMERRDAMQRLVKVGFAVLIISILNGILVVTYRGKSGQAG